MAQKTRAFLLCLMVVAFPALLQGTSICEKKDPGRLFYNSLSYGMYKVDDAQSPVIILENNFDHDNLFLGVDLNLFTTQKKPGNADNIVVRRAEYDTGTEGIRYEPLYDLTFGHGLLLSGYSSLDRQPVIPQNDGSALRAYYLGELFDFETFGTYSHLYGVRMSEDVLGFTVGESYVTDVDGETVLCKDGTQKEIEAARGYSVDLVAPIFGDFDFYAEAAKIEDAGSGYSAGFHWGYNVIFAYIDAKVEGRHLDKEFAPGYFGWGYEMNPIDLTSVEANGKERSGYFTSLRGFVFNYLDFNVAYEGYDDSNGAFFLDSTVKVFEQLKVSAYLKQPSFSEYREASLYEGTITGGTIHMDISPSMFIELRAKRNFDPEASDQEDSSLVQFGSIF